MNILADKIALFTGASKGIGAAIAKDLAAAGASMIINYKTSKVGAEKTVADILAMAAKQQRSRQISRKWQRSIVCLLP